jgi:hypothetical protein
MAFPTVDVPSNDDAVRLTILDLYVKQKQKAAANKAHNPGRLPKGTMKALVDNLRTHPGFQDATRDTINNHERKTKKSTPDPTVPPVPTQLNLDAESSAASPMTPSTATGSTGSTSTGSTTRKNQGGRPKGVTSLSLRLAKVTLEEATTYAAQQLKKKRDIAKANNTVLRCGVINEVIQEANKKYKLANGNGVKPSTVKQRVNRNNPQGRASVEAQTSPMAGVEPLLKDLAIQLQRMGQPLTKDDFLVLAKSIICGTPTEEKVKRHLELSKLSTDTLLGSRYYAGFMKRWRLDIAGGRGYKKDTNRIKWSNYYNMSIMYDCIYKEMKSGGVAVELDPPQRMDREGNIVVDAAVAYGTLLLTPSRILIEYYSVMRLE